MAQDIVLAVLYPIVDNTIGPIKAHICYALYCKSNLRSLKEEVGKLKNEREKLQHLVDEERRNGKVIEQDVDRWLLEVDRIIESREREHVGDEDRAKKKCFVGLCPNFKTRYQLGKKAKGELSTVTIKLEEQTKFGSISYRAAPAGTSAMSVKGYQAMPSRIPIFMEIMNALKLADVKMVGVYGMGGMGKTTLVKEVAVEATKTKLFDQFIVATVTQNQDITKIQGQIADQLGLTFNEESEWGRACRLRDRLKKEKKILIVLDDLWTRLDLDAVGISFEDEQKECKILLTSREFDVLSIGMDVQKNFRLRNLQEEEAWDLFKNTAGGNVENPDVQSVALRIATMCAGLPVAIVTIAKALKDKSLFQWKDALRELQKPSPRNFTGAPGEVYNAIELSYKHLESEELKSTFLLCSRMGYNASIEDLLKYGIGLGLFLDVATIDEARNKVYSLVHKLKNSCLLLDSKTSQQFSIHDVVRDVAISIAFRDRDVCVKSSNEVESQWPDRDSLKYTEIWLHGNNIRLSGDLKHPLLKVFSMNCEEPSLEIPGNIFGGMQKLKVLGLTNFSLPSLPSSLHLLKNLCSLCLHQSSLGEIAIIGELKNLEILSFVKSTIKHLPREIGELTKLKLLDLSDCSELEVISPTIISRLSLLQELCMGNSFHQWDIGPNNVSLVELEHLSRLTKLEIHIPDSRVISKDFSKNLERYRIVIGGDWSWNRNSDGVCETLRKLKLNLKESTDHLKHEILLLLKRTEDLILLEVNGVKSVIELDKEGFLHLKRLRVGDSPEVQYIIDMINGIPSNIPLFLMLEYLYLYNLASLEKIYLGKLRARSFGKLKILQVRNCGKLRSLFSFSMALGFLQLQSITITSCWNMEEIVAEESEEFDNKATNVTEFTQLRTMSLDNLPLLRNFCSGQKTSSLSQTHPKSTTSGMELGEMTLEDDMQSPTPLFDEKVFAYPSLHIT
ncbi:unnamed protein product [Dovyalis caffra]|uniref:AAA+ ATPase domain-containing protein n=1 Tax=Dovyalis caffra TaxID=77055 RepID=A0AAV1RVQ7_9ROSI|nr:unnamed protein product [Dovyalis caffra]